MSTIDYLTRAEVKALTGRSHRAKQAEVLSSRGWPFEVDGDGYPKVDRAEYLARMRTRPTTGWQPDLASLKV